MTSIAPLDPTPSLPSVAPTRGATSGETPSVIRAGAATAAGAGTAGGSFSTSVDPALGITVLKFFSAAGDLTQSFPSRKQLASYQIYGLDKGGSTGASTATQHETTVPAGTTGSAIGTGALGGADGAGITATAKAAAPTPAPVVALP